MNFSLMALIDFYQKPNEITPSKLIKGLSISTIGSLAILFTYSVITGDYDTIGIYLYLPFMIAFYTSGVFERSYSWMVRKIRQREFHNLRKCFSIFSPCENDVEIESVLGDYLTIVNPKNYIETLGGLAIIGCSLSLLSQYRDSWVVILSVIPLMFLLPFVFRRIYKWNEGHGVRFVYFICMATTTPLLHNAWEKVLG